MNSNEHDKPLAWLARIGWASKGIILLTLGMLIAVAAWAHQVAKIADEQEALRKIHHRPFGSVLVAALAAGLLCYAIWQGARAIFDPEGEGREWTALCKRGWFLIISLTNLMLAASAAALALGMVHSKNTIADDATQLLNNDLVRDTLTITGIAGLIYGVVRGIQAIILRHDRSKWPKAGDWSWRWQVSRTRLGLVGRAIIGGAVGCLFLLVGRVDARAGIERLERLYNWVMKKEYNRVVLLAASIILLVWGCYDLTLAARRRFDF